LLVILFPTEAVIAQDKSELFNRIERSVNEKQSEWKLIKKRVYPKIAQAVYEWRSGKASVAVYILVYDSSEEASMRLKALPLFYQGSGLDVRGSDITVLKATVPNLGDENYLWEASDRQRVMGVDFRKGRIVVHTNAPSIAMAEQFALQIAEAIPSSVSRR
jgi:hypothetical protein